MSKTKFIDKEKLKHFEKQLASRDKYVTENGDYIEKKRDKIVKKLSETDAESLFNIIAN